MKISSFSYAYSPVQLKEQTGGKLQTHSKKRKQPSSKAGMNGKAKQTAVKKSWMRSIRKSMSRTSAMPIPKNIFMTNTVILTLPNSVMI